MNTIKLPKRQLSPKKCLNIPKKKANYLSDTTEQRKEQFRDFYSVYSMSAIISEDMHSSENSNNVGGSIFDDVMFIWKNLKSDVKNTNDTPNSKALSTRHFMETITFDINDVCKRIPKPIPPLYFDTWDSSHVRMPCSPQNLYYEDETSVSRWEIIEKALVGPLDSVNSFAEAVLSYNKRYKDQWTHQHLSAALSMRPDYTHLLKKIADLALKLPHLVTQPIPLLITGQEASISLSQLQIACLLANAFYCTFPRRNAEKLDSEYKNYPSINFNALFGIWKNNCKSSDHKVICLLHYFSRVLCSESGPPDGTVTFTRRVLQHAPDFQGSQVLFDSISFGASTSQLIEDSSQDTIQANFANRFLGGGVLRGGCVQEEILLSIKPEILIGRLFTEMLAPNESIIVEGAARYSNYSGYANKFEWAGNYDEALHGNTRDSRGRWKGVVTVIDAIPFRNKDAQFSEPLILRELNKAYAGFSDALAPYTLLPNTVVSGHWGCGAFNGNKELKALIQLMVCAQVGKSLAYCTFNDQTFTKNILNIYDKLCEKKTTIGELYSVLVNLKHVECQGTSREWPFVFQSVLKHLMSKN